MLEFQDSPPPLHHSPSPSDQSQFTSRDTTPVTPVGNGPCLGRKTDRDLLPWFKKPIDVGRTTTSLCIATDSSLLAPDFDDNSFPTFGGTPLPLDMASVARPFGVSARQTSTSPRGNQPSNLTSALQRSDSEEKRLMANASTPSASGRPIPQMPTESSSDLATFGHGARPISVKGRSDERARRESLAQSLTTGMSWGGVSVGSFIRDDMMMSGTSPFAFNSPSFHSSSYLPKLEANFMKDFSCCGLTLPTLHDLLQHYEEAHAQKDPVQPGAIQQSVPDSRAAIAATTAVQVQQEAQQRSSQQQTHNAPGRSFGMQQPNASNVHRPSIGFSNTLQTIPDMDTVEDMEMDDLDGADEDTPPPNLYTQNTQASPHTSFATPLQQHQIPQLNTTMMQGHQAYRQSTPNTPIASGRGAARFQGNTSSTLMANPMQNYQDLQTAYRGTPDSSAPGTPGEMADGLMDGLDDLTMQNLDLYSNGLANGTGGYGFGTDNGMVDLCIDEPSKRLFSLGGQGMTQAQAQQQIQNRLGTGQYGANSDIARTIRERQAAAGLPDTTTNIAPHEEPKPFRCPVIGCEKAYKNQNGLKYHKTHGHNSQRLHENGDGTFSIVDPDTQAPYPGTMGMEKEKPYKCEVCQKRYKNLNGLKYHKTHSPPCNPELLPGGNTSPSQGMSGMVASHPSGNMGAGLSGDMMS